MWVAEGKGHIDGALGHHVVRLRNADTGATHILQIALAHDACPHCGTPTRKGNLDELDPAAIIAEHLAELNASHADVQAYAAKHGLEMRKR